MENLTPSEGVLPPKRKDTVTFHHVVEEEIEDVKSVETIPQHDQQDDMNEIYIVSEEEDDAPYASSSIPIPRYRHPLEDLTDQQLIDIVTDLETDYNHQSLENQIFREFLFNNDPSILHGFKTLFDFAKGEGPAPPELLSDYALRRSGKLDSASLSSMLDTRGPKVNISQKIDMVIKATEDIEAKLEIFLGKSQKVRTRLKAELEEFRIRECDIREARDIFEFNIVTHGVDKLTQRIPAEKFIRYMEDWLKSATLNIEKLRLRTASLQVHFKKVSQTLVQRQELGENVHPVDFDQLEIENKHFLEKIDQKNIHFVELKKMNGGANLVLSKHKKYLQKQQQEYNSLKSKIGKHEKLMLEIEKECDSVAKEAERAAETLEYIKKLKNSYTVPDVMDYIKLKRELNEYRKNVKVWQRRKKIQDITLNACIRQMKNITGSSITDPMWFVDPGMEEGTEEGVGEDEAEEEEDISNL